jgi:tricorn protease
MRKLLICSLLLVQAGFSFAQQTPLWLRYPAISPDGKTIAFGYKGDIYRVDAAGGVAVPLTIHEAQDMMPVWSRDGKMIAFASDRYGNFDVFVMPATGGEAKRLTAYSGADFPYDFTVDNKSVVFGSGRHAPAASARFYSPRLFQNLYTVPVTGGRAMLVSAAGMENAHYSNRGDKIVFQDRKGYEDPWRKHHTSSVTRDVWVMDVKQGKYTKLTADNLEDREPVWSSDDQQVFFLSEKNGNQNIFKIAPQANAAAEQLTNFKDNPVRHLSSSSNNTLCFSQDGEVYTMSNGGSPQKVSIRIYNDGRSGVEKYVSINGNANEFAVSPNGKEIAFVVRGEVFVTSVEGGITKRITNTPQQERMVNWSPDSKTLYYSGERNDNWDIYKCTITRKEEPYFYAATVLKEEALIAGAKEEYQSVVSPDGKEIAYLEERNILKVYSIATKQSRTIVPEGHNYSYSDGDQSFEWSPDSKWLAVDDNRGYWYGGNTGLYRVDAGSVPLYPVMSGYAESAARFGMDGKLMTWMSNRDGRKAHALQGSRELDVYAIFFDKAAYDKFKLGKDDYALWKEKEDGTKKDTAKTKMDSLAKKNWQPDFSNLDDRKVKLTINSASISDYALTDDGSKLYYLAAFEKGFDLWVTETRTKETKILAKLGSSPGSIELSKDGKFVFVINNGNLVKIDDAGKITPVGINGEMVLDAAGERSYIFEHCWRQVQKKFYDPKIHGINWKGYKDTYSRLLPHISNNYDFQELLSEMLGELNGSHTGGRYSPQMQNPDVTASLGIIPDETFTGTGIKVDEVITGGPLDNAASKVKAGSIIEKIDGVAITADIDWYSLLNRKAGKNTLVTVSNPGGNGSFEETLKPITQGEEGGLMYRRFVKRMNDMTEKLSGGKVGYVHVQGMNDGSYREMVDKVMGKNLDKQALIVDTRFNGGGWLHDDLNTFLSGKQYLEFAPQGNRLKDGEPLNRWTKPSCVLMSESNYSDAYIFPYIYKQTGTGKLVGMPVPGTGTAVWWETQIDPTMVFGIPMVATIGRENRPSENLQVEPDIRVPLPYEEFITGKDAQLEAAVRHMLEVIKK